MVAESPEERAKRRSQRRLFDGVADLYDATRRGYPGEIVDFMVTTAGVTASDAVLEVGCGTGQLTRTLTSFGFALTAIDIGPAMITAARDNVAGAATRFEAVSFEDFQGEDGTFGLIVSATAFHWVDPEVARTKGARLLRPGGWLAVLGTREQYDEPLGTQLMDLWIECSSDGGAWTRTKQPTLAEIINGTGLFSTPVERSHAVPLTLTADVVAGLEHTRATTLGYDADTRERFDRRLGALLRDSSEVSLQQQTTLTMAQVLPVT